LKESLYGRFLEMVRNKKGFTLIELLIVVVIIGILAAIAIPKFAGTKSKAYIASMKSDLKNLVLAEESYFTDFNTYAGNVGDANLQLLWTPTTNVAVAPWCRRNHLRCLRGSRSVTQRGSD
jgi:prepilin-type N-terminal cleavage/methylation domain-containing protein